MDHVKFRYMLELPNYLRVLIHLGLRENLFSRVNQQETIKIFDHNCFYAFKIEDFKKQGIRSTC